MKAAEIAAAFEEIIGWPYASPGTNDQSGIDCSGAFVRAFQKHGLHIYHGSNTIYRKHCGETGRVDGDASRLCVGMAVFKQRMDGGEPSQYQGDGNGNLYHVGLVTGVRPLRIVHATPPAARADTSLGQWSHYGRLKAVTYGGEAAGERKDGGGHDAGKPEGYGGSAMEKGESGMKAETARVWAADGNPVKLRPTPSVDKPYLAKAPCGSVVTVYEQAAGWSQVSYQGKRGYMLTEFLVMDAEKDEDSAAEALTIAALGIRMDELERLLAECSERLTACEEGLG